MKKIPIVLSPSDAYSVFCNVTIQSIIECSKGELLDIYILYDTLNEYSMEILNSFNSNAVNISLIDINKYVDTDLMHGKDYVTKNTFFRIISPRIFKHFEKFIYVDSDMVFTKNIRDLYEVDITNYILGAVKNWSTINEIKYVKEELKITNDYYFNAGILLINTNKFLENSIEEKAINLLKEKQFLFFDQDILNITCKGKIKLLDSRWNVVWHFATGKSILNDLTDDLRDKWIECSKKPYVIHYTSKIKPWNSYGIYMSNYFWDCAKRNPYYYELLDYEKNNMKLIIYNSFSLEDVFNQFKDGKFSLKDIIKILINCLKFRFSKKERKRESK